MTNDFLQGETSATNNEWFVASSNKQILQRVTSEFHLVTSNEWEVKPRN